MLAERERWQERYSARVLRPMRALRLGQGSGLGSRGAAAVVPNPTGMTSTAAQQALTAAHLGFAMGATVESDQAAGTVVGQVPGAGERVLQNALVTISTAVPRQVSVPSVVGIALRQARFMLEGFRLTIVLAGGTESDQPPESILTQERPRADQSRSVRPCGSLWRLREPLSCLKWCGWRRKGRRRHWQR